MPSESTASQQAQEFLTPSPVLPRLMKTPAAVHPLPQGGEGPEFPRFPLEIGWLDRYGAKEPELPRITSACAERHSQPECANAMGHTQMKFQLQRSAGNLPEVGNAAGTPALRRVSRHAILRTSCRLASNGQRPRLDERWTHRR